MSDNERDQQDESAPAEDANEDLELKDEDADLVRGGTRTSRPGDGNNPIRTDS